jgi:hypothetical protein
MPLPFKFDLEAIPLRMKNSWLAEIVAVNGVGNGRISLLLEKGMDIPVHA